MAGLSLAESLWSVSPRFSAEPPKTQSSKAPIRSTADRSLISRRRGIGRIFIFVSASEPDIAVTRLIELVKDRIPRRFGFDPVRDIQVLCPMNRGGLGARSLNIELQRALNPGGQRLRNSRRPTQSATKSCRSRMIMTRRSTKGYWLHRRDRSRASRGQDPVRRWAHYLRLRRTRSDRSRLCDDDSQITRLGISCGDHPGHHTALHDAAMQFA